MKKMNTCLLIAFILGVLYASYFITQLGGVIASSEGAEQIGAGFITIVVAPHFMCVMVAVMFNGLGLFLRKSAFALVGAILYTIAMVLFIPYFFFVIIQMILSYVGYSQLKKN